MAIGPAVLATGYPDRGIELSAPVSMTSPWQTIIDPGGLIIQDAATITNPTTQITNATRHIFRRAARGTALILRVAYSSGLTGITPPTVKVFGRMPNDAWQLLNNRASTPLISVPLTMTVATDASDGTLSYSTPNYDSFAWDCLGCGEIIVGVEVALAATGTTSTAFLQGKWI